MTTIAALRAILLVKLADIFLPVTWRSRASYSLANCTSWSLRKDLVDRMYTLDEYCNRRDKEKTVAERLLFSNTY